MSRKKLSDEERNREHTGMRPPRVRKTVCKCLKCRAPKEILQRKSSKYE